VNERRRNDEHAQNEEYRRIAERCVRFGRPQPAQRREQRDGEQTRDPDRHGLRDPQRNGDDEHRERRLRARGQTGGRRQHRHDGTGGTAGDGKPAAQR